MAAAKLTASSVKLSLKSGEYKIRFCSKGKSDVWKECGLVIDREGAELNFAACKSCHQAFAYLSRIGTNYPYPCCTTSVAKVKSSIKDC